MTPENILEINEAMHKTGGKRAAAARLLGMDPQKLREMVHDCPTLRKRWGTRDGQAPAPTSSETISRQPVITKEMALDAAAMEEEDGLIQQSLEAAGLSGEELKVAQSLQQLHGKHYRSCLEMVGGGISVMFMRVMNQAESVGDRVKAGGFTDAEEERNLQQYHINLLNALGMFFDRASKASLNRATVAMIRHKITEAASGGGKRKDKPKFSPLIIAQNAQINGDRKGD